MERRTSQTVQKESPGEHFQKLLNVLGGIEPSALAIYIQQHKVTPILDEVPTRVELKKAIAAVADGDGKAWGADGAVALPLALRTLAPPLAHPK